MNYGFIIDNRKCIGCHACTVACKAEHDVAVGVNRTWVKYIEKGEYPHTRRLFSVLRCNHCADAPCVDICPVTALHYRDDGIVDFDNRRCIGCKACMQACPYDALYIDPETHTAAKCNYCTHRVDIGLEPACVNVCPEHAIISGDMADPTSEISRLLAREQVTARKVEKGTRPKLFYIEGDESSLKPALASQSTDNLWGTQSGGVGHFARYAGKKTAEANPVKMLQQLAGEGGIDAAGRNGGPRPPEQARRVYDAPLKGVLWGWEVAAYVWTKAIAAGAFLVPFLGELLTGTAINSAVETVSLIVALVFLAVTGILLVKDLDRPDRFLYVLLRPQWSSWLARGGYAITLYGAFLGLNALSHFAGISVLREPVRWGAAIFALITAVYTAFLFAQARGRDFWQSPALTLHMVIHAFLAGSAVMALFLPYTGGGGTWTEFVYMVLTVSLTANLLVIAAEMLTPHPTMDAKRTVDIIMRGSLRRSFRGGVIFLGNVLPLLLLLVRNPLILPPAAVLALAGIYLTERIWVRAPQLIPLS